MIDVGLIKIHHLKANFVEQPNVFVLPKAAQKILYPPISQPFNRNIIR